MTINKILDKLKLTLLFDNYENRLTKITYPDGPTSRYIYDGTGKRVKSIENGKITRYLYDGLSVIIERNWGNDTTAYYTRGLSYGGGIGSIISVARQLERKKRGRFYFLKGKSNQLFLRSKKFIKRMGDKFKVNNTRLKRR